MSRRPQTCKKMGCTENRDRYSNNDFCSDHEDEQIAKDQQKYDNDPQRDVERQLDNCMDLDDVKNFIKEHLL